ncbi:MAG: DUF1566 domain-containing protein [Thermodesulfobacteriota bacterium]
MKWNPNYEDLSNVLDTLKKSIYPRVFCVALAFVFISLGAIGGCNNSDGAMTAFLGIHQTGQSVSHVPGDDGDLQVGVVTPEPRFTDNSNGTITDNLTGFVWTTDAGCVENAAWEETLVGATTIGNGDCGLTDGSEPGDWRVANVRELHSLIHYGNSPTLSPGHPFLGISDGTKLWSSTTHIGDSNEAFVVDLSNGEVIRQSKDEVAGCMLVRILAL